MSKRISSLISILFTEELSKKGRIISIIQVAIPITASMIAKFIAQYLQVNSPNPTIPLIINNSRTIFQTTEKGIEAFNPYREISTCEIIPKTPRVAKGIIKAPEIVNIQAKILTHRGSKFLLILFMLLVSLSRI
ncbi:MAG: hypothetical protein AAF806_26405 [Bacteroidota bacterium]